jgi:hypothetical protein
LQAAAGNHTHAIGAITGAGGAASLNVGTTAGTVAAGDHTHALVTGTQFVTKASSTTRTSTTTPADDPDLQLTLAAGTHRLTGLLAVGGGGTGDVIVGWAFTGTWTVPLHGCRAPRHPSPRTSIGGDALSYARASASSATFGTDNSGVPRSSARSLIVVVTVSGTISVQWAQNVSSPTGTVMGAGSTLIAERLA